jgi:pimeloyl-ACP methyl ester carboxylesterase
MKKILLFSLMIMTMHSYAQQVEYGNNKAAGRYVTAGDAKNYYELYGYGEPIVLLHGGIMGSTAEMTQFIDKLKPNYKVIAISSRGHGKSEMGIFPITYEKKAKDIFAVINEVTKDSVTILGFSDGAYTGYKVASMYPERVKKLIAIGAGEQIPGLRKVVFSGGPFDPENKLWKERKSIMPEPERLEDFWAAMETFYNSMTASKELFSSIKCPVLILSGELDRNAPLPTVINAHNMIPNSQLSIIPNTGHVVFMENFGAVWYAMKPFLGINQVLEN